MRRGTRTRRAHARAALDAGGRVNIGRLLVNSPNLLPAALIAAGFVIVLVLWLYPPQVRLLPARFRWILPGLRVLALLALASALLRPVMIRPRTASEQGAIA